MPLECDDFASRKVNWPLPLRSGWVGFRFTAKLPLIVTKPNCSRSLKFNYMPYVKSRFKKDSLLILPYFELLWLNREPGWVKH